MLRVTCKDVVASISLSNMFIFTTWHAGFAHNGMADNGWYKDQVRKLVSMHHLNIPCRCAAVMGVKLKFSVSVSVHGTSACRLFCSRWRSC